MLRNPFPTTAPVNSQRKNATLDTCMHKGLMLVAAATLCMLTQQRLWACLQTRCAKGTYEYLSNPGHQRDTALMTCHANHLASKAHDKLRIKNNPKMSQIKIIAWLHQLAQLLHLLQLLLAPSQYTPH
jgi:hypothetical protein